MKNLINKYLPATVASKIIEPARWVKKKNRQIIRLYRFGNKPFFKEIITKDGNFNIQLQPTKNGCVDETIAEQGFWESELSEQLIKNLKPGDTFVDIGANIGYHSLLISAVSERNVTVHAFEPITNLFNQIEQIF